MEYIKQSISLMFNNTTVNVIRFSYQDLDMKGVRHLSLFTKGKMNFIRKEGHFLFNDALNTFYLRLYGVRHMVKMKFIKTVIYK